MSEQADTEKGMTNIRVDGENHRSLLTIQFQRKMAKHPAVSFNEIIRDALAQLRKAGAA